MSVADAGGGSANCLVSGGTAGRTVQVFYAARGTQVGPYAWTSGGTGTLDGLGEVAVSVTPSGGFGYYQWFAVELSVGGATAGNFSPVYYRPLIDADEQAVWDRCVDGVIQVINSLNLSGLPEAKLVKDWWPKVKRGIEPAPPCCLVSPFAAEDYPLSGVVDEDDVGYPVIVVLVDAINTESQAKMTRDLLWRQKISRALRNQRLAGVPEIYNTQIVPDTVVNPDAYANNILVSPVLYRFTSREPRGLS